MESGENPFSGLKRETLEEAGIEIDIKKPLDVHYFVRDDGQQITMIIFLCEPRSNEIKLSEEHTEFKWIELTSPLDQFPKWLQPVIERYNAN